MPPADPACDAARTPGRTPSPSHLIRVLLVDDHRLLTELMNSLPSLEPDIRVVGVADSVAMAKELIREPMDVALMDYRLRDGTGIEVTRAIKQRWPGARVVMVTAIGDDEMVLESIQAGADGYLTRDRAVADVVAAVRSKLEAVAFALRQRLVDPLRADGNF